ncbi:MAG: PTS glucose transporter subunit IIA [Lactovum sp.]
MFNLFKKKEEVKKETELFSPITGTFMKITEVKDPLFSQKMMGDGFAVYPSDLDSAVVSSPVEGKIISIFPTKHAIGLQAINGEEVILHIGINTVDLNGVPFDLLVKEGQEVTQDTKLIKMNLSYLKDKEIDPSVIVVFTNLEEKLLEIKEVENVQNSELLGRIK